MSCVFELSARKIKCGSTVPKSTLRRELRADPAIELPDADSLRQIGLSSNISVNTSLIARVIESQVVLLLWNIRRSAGFGIDVHADPLLPVPGNSVRREVAKPAGDLLRADLENSPAIFRAPESTASLYGFAESRLCGRFVVVRQAHDKRYVKEVAAIVFAHFVAGNQSGRGSSFQDELRRTDPMDRLAGKVPDSGDETGRFSRLDFHDGGP